MTRDLALAAAADALELAALALRDASRSSAPPATPPELLTVEEAARRLAVGRSLAYELIRNGRLRTVRLGRRRLVPASALAEVAQEV